MLMPFDLDRCRPGITPLGALPDPELIFDSIMARKQYRKHPNNVSSVLWYWATIIIHVSILALKRSQEAGILTKM